MAVTALLLLAACAVLSVAQCPAQPSTYPLLVQSVPNANCPSVAICRVFIQLATVTDRITIVTSNSVAGVTVTPSGPFYQHALGSDLPPTQNLVNVVPDVGCDSYVTVGSEFDGGRCVNADASFNSSAFNSPTQGAIVPNSGWFCQPPGSPPFPAGFPGMPSTAPVPPNFGNAIMIAQLSTQNGRGVNGQLLVEVKQEGVLDPVRFVRNFTCFCDSPTATVPTTPPTTTTTPPSTTTTTTKAAPTTVSTTAAATTSSATTAPAPLCPSQPASYPFAVETIDNPACPDVRVCRLSIVLDNADDRITIVTANTVAGVTLTPPGPFFQSTLGSDTPPLGGVVAAVPSVGCDSYVTIGSDVDAGKCVVTDASFNSGAFNSASAGSIPPNSGWFCQPSGAPPFPNGFPGSPATSPKPPNAGNSLLLAQLSVPRSSNAAVSGQLLVEIRQSALINPVRVIRNFTCFCAPPTTTTTTTTTTTVTTTTSTTLPAPTTTTATTTAAPTTTPAPSGSPRKMFIYSNLNTRGRNRVTAFSFHYDETLRKVGEWPTDGFGDGLGQFGVDRIVALGCLEFVYASNDATQTISVFRVNRNTGVLTLLPLLTVTLASRALERFEDVALSLTPNGRFLIVGLGSSFITNRVLSYRINADGSLTLVSQLESPVISLPLRLSQLAVNPHSNLLAVSYTSVAGYVALYGIDANGVLTELDLLPDMAAFGRVQGLAWSPSGDNLYAALVNNRPASVAGIGMTVTSNTTLGLQWMLQSSASDDSNLVAVDPVALDRLFFSTQRPAIVVTTPPLPPPDAAVTVTASAMVPSLLSVPFGTTIVFTSGVTSTTIIQGTGPVSCAPKRGGFRSPPLASGQTWRYTFDVPGPFFVLDEGRCLSSGVRLLVIVGDKPTFNDTGATVNPLRARATSLAFTWDGEHLLTGLQLGGFVVQRVAANASLSEVAFSNVATGGLQGTSTMVQSPMCCRNDQSGPVLEWDSVLNVACDVAISGPVVKLLAGCDWTADQVQTEGVAIPTCNAYPDALFRVTLTDLCGQSSVATQYIRHAPDVEPPVITGGTVQARECRINQDLVPDTAQLVVVDQCQPRSSLNITYQLGPIVYPAPRTCLTDKVVASRSAAWTVADPCGNTARASGRISFIDTLAPLVSIPDWEVPCALNDQCVAALDNGGINATWTGYATAYDLCMGPVATSFVDLPPPPGAVPGCTPVIRQWSARDACGNVARVNQTIAWEAARTPQFVIPPNVAVECGWDLGMDRTGYPTIQAPPCVNLQKRVDTFRERNSTQCRRRSLRKFMASKTTCGAWSASGEQYIEEIDTLGPKIVFSSPIHVSCRDGEDPWPSNPAVGWPVVVDACQGVLPRETLTWEDIRIRHVVRTAPNCLDEITRVWSAVDPCGNRANATQIIFASRRCQEDPTCRPQ